LRQLRLVPLLAVTLLVGVLVFAGRLAPNAHAQTPADQSEVVLVLDFSASILDDVANRDRFAAALVRIADRIDAISSDLVAGDATVTIVQFATRAADYPGCADLRLLGSPQTVARFADCLRNVAKAYRTGLDPALTKKIGIDTNYVDALETAAQHLAVDAARPALILFTDGKHDVPGVPVSEVEPTRDRLFGSRSPFALLPVGMGLDPAERGTLESGLLNLRIIRDMPACISGARFEWPQVVFESADDAGNAVAVALQDATCTFTVAPTPSSTSAPTPSPVPTATGVRGVTLAPGDGSISVAWLAPATTSAPITDYRIRCRSGDGDWIESGEGASLETSAVVEGLTNGLAYECEVATVSATSLGLWVAAPATVTPVGTPAAPGKPVVQALDRAVQIALPSQGAPDVSGYRFECSGDQGRTWSAGIDVPAAGSSTAEIGNLTNGVEYVCRGYAANTAGLSDPSEASDAVRPCGSLLECNPGATPVVGILGFVGLGGLLLAVFALYRQRTRGYVVAVVDFVHTANLGHGSTLGIGFIRARPGGPVTGVVADRSRAAELRIRHRRGDRFEVTDRSGRHIAMSGEAIVAIDSRGVQHSVVLRRFSGSTASSVLGGK
jgi:hypothetical protein